MPTTRIHRPVPGVMVPQKLLVLPLCLLVFGAAGCVPQRRPKFEFASLAVSRPILPVATAGNSLADLPDLDLNVAILPPPFTTARSVPARPHVAPPLVVEPAPASKHKEPIMAPELSTEELSIAKGETQRSLDAADHNLALTQGKHLNPAQNDLVSKVRGFAESARDAVRDGDWSRAKSLAKKAEVLSQELVDTL